MKNLSILILLIVSFLACKNEPKITPLKFTSQTIKQEKVEADSSSFFTADVQYLVAEGGNPNVAKAINDSIRNAIVPTLSFVGDSTISTKIDISAALALFRKSYENERAEQLKSPIKERFFSSYDYVSTVKEGVKNAKTTSIFINENYYTGGAHPNTSLTSYVFDNQTGKAIPLTALVKNKEALVKILETYFRAEKEIDPKTPLEEVIFEHDGGKYLPLPRSYELSEDGKGITFIYESYEVAAYAFGPSVFTVPFEVLGDCLDLSSIK
jgi:Deacetylase PdaC/Protein of unknown function (DUF3298)